MIQKLIISLLFTSIIGNSLAANVHRKPAGTKASLLPPLPAKVPLSFNKVEFDHNGDGGDRHWSGELEMEGTVTGLDAYTNDVTYDCASQVAQFKFHVRDLKFAGLFNVISGSETLRDWTEPITTKYWQVKGPGSFTLTPGSPDGFSFEANGRLMTAEKGLRFQSFHTSPTLPQSDITRDYLEVKSSQRVTELVRQEVIDNFLSYFSIEIQKLVDTQLRTLLDTFLANYSLEEFAEATGANCRKH